MGDNPNTEEGSVLNTGHRCQWKHNYKKEIQIKHIMVKWATVLICLKLHFRATNS